MSSRYLRRISILGPPVNPPDVDSLTPPAPAKSAQSYQMDLS
jgi:hypothetical protein